MSYLRYLCLFAYSVVQRILCCVFIFVLFVFVLCLVYTLLPVSLDCLCLLAPLVFSNVYIANRKFKCCYNINIVLLRDVFHIGLVIGPRPAVLA